MGTQLRVLIVEDSVDDTDLLLREIRRAGYEPIYDRVDTPDGLRAALDGREWDVILSDYTMPSFSGTQALAMVRDRGLDIPFIFISGTIGEDLAVAAMRAGAHDYVTKGSLKRLIPAIERELREAELRRARARAEAERRAAEARYGQVLNMAADAIVALDEDRRIVVFNKAAEAIFGYTAEEATGQPVNLLLPSRYAAEGDGELADGPSWTETADGPREIYGCRKNGEEFPAEASISTLAENGRRTVTAVIRDIGERRRSEAKLRQLLQAVEQSINLVIITNADGRIEYVNPAFLEATEYDVDEIVGREPSPWKFGPEDEAAFTALWQTLLAGDDWRGEFSTRRKSGGMLAVAATISPIRDEKDRLTHFIGILEDVTRRKEIEEQLRRAQRMEAIGQLTGGLAHDFNNLLTVIIGNIDLLTEQLPPYSSGHGLATLALNASLRGADLTRQLLAFARRQSLEPQVCQLNEMIPEMMDLLRRTLGEQVEVVIEPAADLWLAFVDPTQVESAVLNLAINARDAMPQGGCLTISTANRRLDEDVPETEIDVTPGDYVMVAVSDTGSGMTAETLSRVFEPFFTTKPQGKGTGLGLSMVYGFVKQSRGHVRIESEVGRGTTVRLYLPRAGAAHRQEEQAPGPSGSPRASGETTILVVEDNEGVRDLVVQQLTELGYRAIAVGNGAAALELLEDESRQIDLLFSDIVMPGGTSGIDLLRHARERRPQIKVLLTSGFAEVSIPKDEETGEPIGFLSKPYRKHELARRIQETLAR